MNVGNKQRYVQCLEQHQELAANSRDLIEVGGILSKDTAPAIDGNEDFAEKAKSSLVSVGRGLFSVSRWVGGKAIDGFMHAITSIGNALAKAFDTNKSLIDNVQKDAGKLDGKDHELTAKKVASITAKGDLDHLMRDMDTLIHVLELHDKHGKDLIGFLDKELVVLKKLKSVKKADQIHGIIDEFNELKYPTFDLGNHMGDAYKSDPLPGGRFIMFTHKDGSVPTYSFSGDAAEGEAGTLNYSKAQISELMAKLDKVNALHMRAKASYENYLGFIKSWAEMVKGVDGNLSQLDQVSKTVIGEAEKLMTGNMGALAFYSGFTPRVVGYADKYVHGVLGVFA